MKNQETVHKLWNLCNVLRDEGITYNQYVTELTYILFLKIAKATGDAWLSFDEYDKAAAMYQLALTKGGVDADLVNTRLGIALAKKGDKAGAKAAFAKVGGARASTARLWTIYVDSGVTA